MNNSRTVERTKALQVLFAYEFHEQLTPLIVNGLVDLSGEELTNLLISEYLIRRIQIDELIVKQLKNWELSRVNLVDRNILRLGVLELLLKTADRAVIINEYIEISKIWGTEKSGKFINGILDAVLID